METSSHYDVDRLRLKWTENYMLNRRYMLLKGRDNLHNDLKATDSKRSNGHQTMLAIFRKLFGK